MAKDQQKMFRPDFSTTRDARVLQTRRALRDALLELLRHQSIDKISIREIVARAGVGYNTFFRHYQNKEAMLDDIAAEEIEHLVSLSLPVLDAEDTLASCVTLCSHVWENRELWQVLLTGGAAGALRQEYLRISREVAAKRTRGKDWIPLDIAVILVTSGMIELFSWWLAEKDPLPVEDVARICQEIVVSPVVDA